MTAEHPSRDKSARFALDMLLREYGYTIHSRKKGCEPTWEYLGEIFSESEALAYMDADDIYHAKWASESEFEDRYS